MLNPIKHMTMYAYLIKFNYVPVLHIRSKAFSRSRNIAPMALFSMKAILILEDSLTRWSMIDLCFRKQDWLFEMRLFLSIWEFSLNAIMVSMILQIAGVSETGL